MAITVEPQSNITLVKCPLEADLKNTFTFSSLANQTTYFNGLTSKVIGNNNYAYVKKDGFVDVDEPLDTLLTYNYLYYTNTGFSNKRFYCFIDKLEYVNENTSRIYFHTDVFQTWYFQLTWNRCFVEREHVNDDTFGTNTVPENVELGDYVCNGVSYAYSSGTDCYIALAASYVPDDIALNTNNVQYNGIYYGTPILLFQTPLAVTNYIKILDKLDKGDSISCIFIVPKSMFTGQTITFNTYTIQSTTTELAKIPNTEIYTEVYSASFLMKSNLNGYTPKNNKLFTYPYNYGILSNNVGQNAEIHYENFDFSNQGGSLRFNFTTLGALTPGCSIRCYPQHYNLLSDSTTTIDNQTVTTGYSYDYGVTGPKYPICSWNTDVYTNWLTSQGVNLGISFASSIASLGVGAGLALTGVGTGVGIGMMAGGITGIGASIASIYSHSLVPPSAEGNVNSGDVTFSAKQMRIPFRFMSIRYEFAKIIDDYFSAYGYKVNRIKVPNITGRSQWNFIKTIDCNVEGDIPQEDLQTIRDACNTGVTFWHTPANIYNYSLNNPIV